MSCLRPKPRAAAADRCTEVTITKMQLTATNGPGGRKYLPPPRRRNTTYLWLMVYLVLQNIAKPRRALCLYMGGYKTLRSRNRENCLSLPRYPACISSPTGCHTCFTARFCRSPVWQGSRPADLQQGHGAPADRLNADRSYPSALYCAGGLPPGFLCQGTMDSAAGLPGQGKGEKLAPNNFRPAAP